MIEFNLLPDVKLAYMRAQRFKRLVITASVFVVMVTLLFSGILALNVYILQRNHIASVTEDIQLSAQEIREIDQIDRVLTVQNQLNTISGLHEEKPVVSRLFSFIATVTPLEVEITELEVNFDEEVIVISGETATLENVNVYTDTLKFTEYMIVPEDLEDDENALNNLIEDEDTELLPAFKGVELNDFTRNPDGASFVIRIRYNPEIFSSDNLVQLIIEETISTRSEQETPDVLFIAPTEEEEEEEE